MANTRKSDPSKQESEPQGTAEPNEQKVCAVKTASRIPVADRGSRERCFRVNRLTRR